MSNKNESAFFGGGCFWCLEAVFSKLRGVDSVISGYAGGEDSHPSYEKVCSGKTGHAEIIKVDHNPEEISYEDLLRIFFSVHDPTTINKQGNDIGSQYRSIILHTNEEQKELAFDIMEELSKAKFYQDKIVTEIEKLNTFYQAEDYHQKYFEKNPNQSYCQAVISPKISKLKEEYKTYIKSSMDSQDNYR